MYVKYVLFILIVQRHLQVRQPSYDHNDAIDWHEGRVRNCTGEKLPVLDISYSPLYYRPMPSEEGAFVEVEKLSGSVILLSTAGKMNMGTNRKKGGQERICLVCKHM